MKKMLLALAVSVLGLQASLSQNVISFGPDRWATIEDSSAFDGVSLVAFVVGTSDDYYVTSPVLSLVRTDDGATRAYLAYFPAELCGTTSLLLKFDRKEPLYAVSVRYSTRSAVYVVDFDGALTIESFVVGLETCRTLHARMLSRCGILDVDFTLNGAAEALKILEK